MSLGEAITQDQVTSPPPPTERPVAAHTRRATPKTPDTGDDSLPFFDEARVPVEVIELAAPEAAGLAPEDFEIIGHKDSYRLAQRPGSYRGAQLPAAGDQAQGKPGHPLPGGAGRGHRRAAAPTSASSPAC
jgi:hypothetical protein